jgi:hypothetical protein
MRLGLIVQYQSQQREIREFWDMQSRMHPAIGREMDEL